MQSSISPQKPIPSGHSTVVRQRWNGTTGEIDSDYVHGISWTYPRYSPSICLTGVAVCTNLAGAWATKHELLKRRGHLRGNCPHPTKILVLEKDNPRPVYSKLVARAKPRTRERALNMMKTFRTLLAKNRGTITIEPLPLQIARPKLEIVQGPHPRSINRITGKPVVLTADEKAKDQRRDEWIAKLEQPAVGKKNAMTTEEKAVVAAEGLAVAMRELGNYRGELWSPKTPQTSPEQEAEAIRTGRSVPLEYSLRIHEARDWETRLNRLMAHPDHFQNWREKVDRAKAEIAKKKKLAEDSVRREKTRLPRLPPRQERC